MPTARGRGLVSSWSPRSANVTPGSRGSTAYGIMVLTVHGDHITEITGFADPVLFPFGLPARMEG